MSLVDRYAKPPTGASPEGFTCQHYQAVPDGKRCVHYIDNGACAREDEFMCIEWLKVNHPESPLAREARSMKPRTDLFGQPLPVPDRPQPPPAEEERSAPKKEEAPSRKDEEPPVIRNITDEEIASFRALNATVCIRSEDVGDVWLVPEYTDRDRFELRIDHAATLTAICAAFPGAKVTEVLREEPATSDSQTGDPAGVPSP